MDIIVNGNTHTIQENSKVTDLISLFSLDGKRFAIEVNKELVLRNDFATTSLHAGDKVEIVGAIGGG